MKWIIKEGEHFRRDNNSQKALVTLVQKNNFTGVAGEDVLVLKKKSDWHFSTHYKIASVDFEDQDGGYNKISITLALVRTFQEEKMLEDYVYSLKRITNYVSPIKHFNRKYSRLHDAEFEAIVEDKIYLKRTILGTVLNAMHPDHQKGYISYAAMEAPEILTGKTDMDRALTLLLQYLDFAVVKPANYLKESSELLETITNELNLGLVGFAEDIDNISPKHMQMIKPQVDLINEYMSDMFTYNNDKLSLQLIELEDNRKFKTLFKNAPLPITLN